MIRDQEPWDVFNNFVSLNAGTNYFPEPAKYEVGDYVLIIDKKHPFYGQAARIIGIQQDLFQTESVGGSPALPVWGRNLYAILVEPQRVSLTELILRPKRVKKIEKR